MPEPRGDPPLQQTCSRNRHDKAPDASSDSSAAFVRRGGTRLLWAGHPEYACTPTLPAHTAHITNANSLSTPTHSHALQLHRWEHAPTHSHTHTHTHTHTHYACTLAAGAHSSSAVITGGVLDHTKGRSPQSPSTLPGGKAEIAGVGARSRAVGQGWMGGPNKERLE